LKFPSLSIDPSTWIRVARTADSGYATVTRRRIYILPTRYGLLFALLLFLLLVGSINYANNPAFLLTFLLSGLLVLTIFKTWRNLLNLQLKYLSAPNVFVKQEAAFNFQVHAGDQIDHLGIQLSFADQKPLIFDLTGGTKKSLSLHYPTQRRGRLAPGRLTIETRYPLGLFRAWSYLETSASAVVYPNPAPDWRPGAAPDYTGVLEGDRGQGSDDFMGHRAYRDGDRPKQIDWKAYAARKGLLVKLYGGDRAEKVWLDYDDLTGLDPEHRLRMLCRGVLEFERKQLRYGLRLPDQTFGPNNGSHHQQACLTALGLFGLS
jgi:uncharacterized protein (DUF58 family)